MRLISLADDFSTICSWTVESIERGPVAEVLAASATLRVIEG